ncbi:MAG: hypothetical protein HY319_20260 [Armatimonadetes bacterium]|nr:hypothetical protein [Armatimonadota bacterium]
MSRFSSPPTEPAARSRRGVTLLELLIASGLVLLVALSVLALFEAGVRYVRESEARLDIQRDALVAMALVTQELSESNPVAFRTDPDPPGVVFGSPRNLEGTLIVDSSGKLIWQKFICYYLEDSGAERRLIRKERMLDPTVRVSFPPAPGAGLSTADFLVLPIPARTIAGGIESFAVTPSTQVDIELTAARRDWKGRDFRVRLQSSVLMRN